MENSYSNSNNGGSVNSQDSLYKMAAAAGNPGNLISQHHQYVERQVSIWGKAQKGKKAVKF
jgi:echinoid